MKNKIAGVIAGLVLTACGHKSSLDARRMAQSVVQVKTERGRGTGFVVRAGDRTVIVTAAHVVADAGGVQIEKEQLIAGTAEVARTIYPDVDVLAIDFERDLAVLEVPHLAADALEPLPLDTKRCDDAAVGWGYPPTAFTESREQGLTKSELSGIKRVQLDATESLGGADRVLSKESVSGLVFTPVLEPGNSGGPIMSRDGKVVGVTVMKSLEHPQGAAVCAEHVEPLLAAAIARHAEPTRAEATAFASSLVTEYLPYAETSSRPARDFLHPSLLQASYVLSGRFLMAAANTSALGLGTHSQSSMPDAFKTMFPEVLPRMIVFAEACAKQGEDRFASCLADVAALPVSLSLVRAELEGKTGIQSITAVGDPRRVSKRPAVYEVPFAVHTASGDQNLQLRLRWDYGRLWLVTDEPEAALTAAMSSAAATEHATAERYVGDWIYEDQGTGETSGSRFRYTVRHTLAVRNSDAGLVVEGDLSFAHRWLNADLIHSCNNRNRVAYTVHGTWSAAVSDGDLLLSQTSQTSSHDASPCGWPSSEQLRLGLGDGGIVIRGYAYGDGRGNRDVPFRRP